MSVRTFDLRGRRALVTEGTRGVGRAAVLALAEAGADIVTCYGADEDGADSLERELKETNGDHLVVRADVTQTAGVAQVVEACRAQLGCLEIVVNAAGTTSRRPFAELTLDEWREAVDANLTSAFLVTQGVLPLLSTGASVIHVGSTDGTRGVPEGAHYTAAKAGLIGFTRSLARELGPDGTRVNLVAHGPLTVDGPGRPEDVAAVVVFLASEEAGAITGETFVVDGGES